MIEALEQATDKGKLRIRFHRGWVSESTEGGVMCLHKQTQQEAKAQELDPLWKLGIVSTATEEGQVKAQEGLHGLPRWQSSTKSAAESYAKSKGGVTVSAMTYAKNAAEHAADAGVQKIRGATTTAARTAPTTPPAHLASRRATPTTAILKWAKKSSKTRTRPGCARCSTL